LTSVVNKQTCYVTLPAMTDGQGKSKTDQEF